MKTNLEKIKMENRYSRHEVMPEFKNQKELEKARIAIIGLGGTGSTCSQFLVRAGITNLTLIDFDKIEESNLQRQTMYKEKDIGESKVQVASQNLKEINSEIKLNIIEDKLTKDNVDEFLKEAEIIVDCSDCPELKLLINDYCLKEKKPCVFASVMATEGLLYVLEPTKVEERGCYACIFKDKERVGNAASHGILNTNVAQAALMQATEAMKLALGIKPEQDLISFNSWAHEIKRIKIKKNKNCKSCN